MEQNIAVTIFLHNGTQVVGYFPKIQLPSVQDLKEFVERASGIYDGYHLFQIAPTHKKLDNMFDSITTSTVVQIKDGAKNEIPYDSVALSPASKSKVQFTSGNALSGGQYYEPIMLAFMFTATNLVGVALLALLYLNFAMFWPYVTPFFCAVLVGLTLRGPRDKIVKYLAPLSKIESETTRNLPFMYIRKTKYIVIEIFSNTNVPYILLGSLFFLTMGVLYTSMIGSWRPVMVGVFILLLLLIISIIFLSPPTFAAVLLLTALVLIVGTILLFGTTSLIHEGLILLKLLEPHLQVLSEKRYAADTFMEMMGVGSEYRNVFTSLHEVVVNRLNTTWGFNISEFGNLTELSTTTKFGDLPRVEEFLKYDYTALMEWISGSWGVTTRNVVMHVSGWAFGTSFYMLKVLARFSTSFYNLVISVTVFMTSLYLYLVSNKNWVSEVVRLFPMTSSSSSSRVSVDDQIREAFTGIVLTTFVICIADATVTYMIVAWVAYFPFPFMYTFVSALLTLFPVAYPWVLQVLLVLYMYPLGDEWLRGGWVTLLFIMLTVIDTKLYSYLAPSSSSPSVVFPHQWVSGLSVVTGLYAFGLQGILVGPVLVYLTIILYRAFVDALKDPRRSSSLVDVLRDTGRKGSSFFRRG